MSGIVVDKEIMGGDPVIAGTRIPVAHILFHLARGQTPEQIVRECYPQLTSGQVMMALRFAALTTTLDDFEDLLTE